MPTKTMLLVLIAQVPSPTSLTYPLLPSPVLRNHREEREIKEDAVTIVCHVITLSSLDCAIVAPGN